MVGAAERGAGAAEHGKQEQEHDEERVQRLTQEGVSAAYQLKFSPIQRLFCFGVLSGTHHTHNPLPQTKNKK